MKNTLIGILVVIVIGLGVYTITQRKAGAPTTGELQPGISLSAPMEKCGLKVTYPFPGSTVAFPLTINAIIDNTQAATLGCSWTVFEAQAGTVVVKDSSGTVLANTVLTTTSNWMTTSPTPYTATVAALSNPAYTGPLTITFEEENPSGEGVPDTMVLPVVK